MINEILKRRETEKIRKEEMAEKIRKEEMEERLEMARIAAGSSYVNYLEIFKKHLLEHHINRPDEKVLNVILKKFPYQLIVSCTNSNMAYDLYHSAKDLPSTTTLLQINIKEFLNVNGFIDPSKPNLLSASDEDGKQFILKLLVINGDDHRSLIIRNDEIINETKAIEILDLKKPTVPFVSQELIAYEDKFGKVHNAIKMPRYIVTVARAPKFFTRALVIFPFFIFLIRVLKSCTHFISLLLFFKVKGIERMIEAISFLHDNKIVHMDIKGDNIFINENGDWFLGYFYFICPLL